MLNYIDKLTYFMSLWNERNDVISECYAINDNYPTILVEKKIKEIGAELSVEAFENKEMLLEEFSKCENQLKETCIAYVLFNTFDNSLLDQCKYIFEEYLTHAMLSTDQRHHPAIRKALIFSSETIATHFTRILMNSDLYFSHEIGLTLINQFSLSLILQGKTNLYTDKLKIQEIDFSFLEASSFTQNKELVTHLKYTLNLDFVAPDNNPGLRVHIYKTLLSLGETSTWKTFLQKSENYIFDESEIFILTQFGGPKQSQFIKNQLSDLSDLYTIEAYIWPIIGIGDLRSIDSLFLIFENIESDEIKKLCIQAYGKLTGQSGEIEIDLESEDHEHVAETLRWWWENDKTEKGFDLTKRYMDGKLFSIKTLIDELTDLNDIVRMSARQKLFAYTGERFTFNDQGFFVDMIEQQKVWYDWYHQNKAQFPDGHWYLGGKMVE